MNALVLNTFAIRVRERGSDSPNIVTSRTVSGNCHVAEYSPVNGVYICTQSADLTPEGGPVIFLVNDCPYGRAIFNGGGEPGKALSPAKDHSATVPLIKVFEVSHIGGRTPLLGSLALPSAKAHLPLEI